MIKANELRIGNYVADIWTPSGKWQIKRFTNKTAHYGDFNCKVEHLLPIPLTEELLLKCGFNNEYKNGYIGIDVNNSDFVLTYPKIMGEWQECFSFEFKAGGISKFKEILYLHELQNLFFFLTGRELEIKL